MCWCRIDIGVGWYSLLKYQYSIGSENKVSWQPLWCWWHWTVVLFLRCALNCFQIRHSRRSAVPYAQRYSSISSLTVTYQTSSFHMFTFHLIPPVSHMASSIAACVFQLGGAFYLLQEQPFLQKVTTFCRGCCSHLDGRGLSAVSYSSSSSFFNC